MTHKSSRFRACRFAANARRDDTKSTSSAACACSHVFFLPIIIMSITLSLLFNGIGACLILHAAYSCLHFRNIVADLDLVDGGETAAFIPPFDVVVECLGGFLVLLSSQIFISSGSLVPIAATSSSLSSSRKQQPLVAPAYKTRDFEIYSNRAHVMKR